MRLEGHHIIHNLPWITLIESDSQSNKERQCEKTLFEGVSVGQIRQDGLTCYQVSPSNANLDIRDEVLVGQFDTLGITSSAGCVADDMTIVWLGRRLCHTGCFRILLESSLLDAFKGVNSDAMGDEKSSVANDRRWN